MSLRVLTWNLKHGRAVPSAGHDLFGEFAAALGGWGWDVALLQEVPPSWPPRLAGRLGAEQRLALTSRNALLPVRRFAASRWPDAIKSNGGGSNAILVRGGAGAVGEHRVARLGWRPERRWVHGVQLGAGVWVANVHAQALRAQASRAARVVQAWPGEGAVVLGGDFNLRGLELDGFTCAAAHGVDYVFARGFAAASEVAVLERGGLSDHDPIAVTLRP